MSFVRQRAETQVLRSSQAFFFVSDLGLGVGPHQRRKPHGHCELSQPQGFSSSEADIQWEGSTLQISVSVLSDNQ